MRGSLWVCREDGGIVERSLPWPAMSLLPPLERQAAHAAVVFPDGSLRRDELERAASALRTRLPSRGPVALWAAPHTATAIGLVAGLRAGLQVVPLDVKGGPAELARIVEVCRPSAALAP